LKSVNYHPNEWGNMAKSNTPEQYVNENAEELTRIIKHSSNTFPRALALAALVEYGEDPTVEAVIEDLERLRNQRDDEY